MNLELPIHHIGVATHKISDELFYYKALGFVCEDEFVDKTQGVRGLFLVSSNIQMPQYRLELLENLEANGPLDNYLQNHTKMYHIAYETQSIEKSVENLFASLDYQNKLNLEIDKSYMLRGGGEKL
ncbi:VOC family protein [Helicobacter sp. MIT 11-5569]|uniref:VOC family protein n=1 Tax=Helicobacter sp. MIT 11-5569 TaxID=1548151 RepID=UPI000B1AEC04|nr:VOC family protein [Helicobacter sp. MIT 11-5569]TLD81162.1 VOC family protein [Helicobacter sp. MIT 11-5569]